MKTILVIEDEKNIRKSIVEILRVYGFATISAENGKEGLEAALIQKPDLIFCDVMMPEMDGYEVLEELKKNPAFNTPFIFLTAKSQSEDIRKGISLGADEYIVKPFKASDLIDAIGRAFSNRSVDEDPSTSKFG
jgi:CheY-like chemotaxis protein